MAVLLCFGMAGCGLQTSVQPAPKQTGHQATVKRHKITKAQTKSQAAPTQSGIRLRPFGKTHVAYRTAVVVLMYHAIGIPEAGDTIAAWRFKAEMQALLHAGYNFLTLSEPQRIGGVGMAVVRQGPGAAVVIVRG